MGTVICKCSNLQAPAACGMRKMKRGQNCNSSWLKPSVSSSGWITPMTHSNCCSSWQVQPNYMHFLPSLHIRWTTTAFHELSDVLHCCYPCHSSQTMCLLTYLHATASILGYVSCCIACLWCITHARVMLVSDLFTWSGHMTLYSYMAVDCEVPPGDRLAMHRTHDMCQMLQSETIALRQTLQHALEHSPACRARSSSRGLNQAAKGTRSALKLHTSFLAELASNSVNRRRCCSPTLNRDAGLQEDTAQYCDDTGAAPCPVPGLSAIQASSANSE